MTSSRPAAPSRRWTTWPSRPTADRGPGRRPGGGRRGQAGGHHLPRAAASVLPLMGSGGWSARSSPCAERTADRSFRAAGGLLALAVLFGLAALVLLAGGKSRGYGLCWRSAQRWGWPSACTPARALPPDRTVRRPDGPPDCRRRGRAGRLHPLHRPGPAAGGGSGRRSRRLLLPVRRAAPVRGGGEDRGLVQPGGARPRRPARPPTPTGWSFWPDTSGILARLGPGEGFRAWSAPAAGRPERRPLPASGRDEAGALAAMIVGTAPASPPS